MICLQQMEKQGVEKHTGMHTVVAQDACRLLQCMMQAPWIATHLCKGSSKTECVHCELTIVWHQLALELVFYVAQENPAHPPDVGILIYQCQPTQYLEIYVSQIISDEINAQLIGIKKINRMKCFLSTTQEMYGKQIQFQPQVQKQAYLRWRC